jgi:hypothetical protein
MGFFPDNSYCLIFLTFFGSDVSLSSGQGFTSLLRTVGDLNKSLNLFFVKHCRFHPRLSNDRVHATVLSMLWAYHSLPFPIPGWFVL